MFECFIFHISLFPFHFFLILFRCQNRSFNFVLLAPFRSGLDLVITRPSSGKYKSPLLLHLHLPFATCAAALVFAACLFTHRLVLCGIAHSCPSVRRNVRPSVRLVRCLSACRSVSSLEPKMNKFFPNWQSRLISS